MSDSFATCPPLLVNFTQPVLHYNQITGILAMAISLHCPTLSFYTYPGIYRARLTITSPGGCIDTFVKIITVKGPQGSFTYDKLKGCIPTIVRFSAQTNQSVRFVWDYNDGGVDESSQSALAHTYTTMGEYLPPN